MSNAEEILKLRLEYEPLLHTDAEFSARVKLARNVLEELHSMDRLDPSRDSGLAAFVVVAALEKALPLLAENRRLQKALLDADSALTEAAVGFEGTAERMHREALLPKAQRSPDFDHDDMLRYSYYATMARSSLVRFKKAAGLR